MKKVLACALALAFLATGAAAEEKIDNPLYQHWSKFKVGTWVRLKSSVGAGEASSVTKMTTKLVELTAEQAVLEVSVVVSMGGQEFPGGEPTRQPVPAKIDKVEPPKTDDPNTPKVTTKEGKESIEIGGKKVECKTVESTMEFGGMKTWSKAWMSEDVPGQMVKAESKTEGQVASSSTTVVEDYKVA